MKITMWLSRYFGIPAARSRDVSEEFAGEQALNPDDMLIFLPPCLLVECSFSLLFAQDVDEEAVSEVLPRVVLLRDCGRTTVLSLDRDAQEKHCVYVDSVGMIGSNVGVVTKRMELVQSFERQDLETSRAGTPLRRCGGAGCCA